MPIIIVIAALCVLKYFDVWRFAEMSWWWIIGLMGVAFIWFEFIEPAFGLDKKKAHADDEKMRKARVQKAFGQMRKK